MIITIKTFLQIWRLCRIKKLLSLFLYIAGKLVSCLGSSIIIKLLHIFIIYYIFNNLNKNYYIIFKEKLYF